MKNLISTPAAVGPGRYVPEASALPSEKPNMPRWTLPKAGRPEVGARKYDKNQTYDGRSGFGAQPISKNKTFGTCHFGTSGRTHSQKLGTFKDMMQTGTQVRIQHPKY